MGKCFFCSWLYIFLFWTKQSYCCCCCYCSNGVWKVVATFQNSKQHNYSAEFEVKEYGKTFTIVKYFRLIWLNIFNTDYFFSVLPSFEVKITPTKKFFYVNDDRLTVDIKATWVQVHFRGYCRIQIHMYNYLLIMKLLKRNICALRYLFGKAVEGNAYVVFGMFDENKEKYSFPSSIQRVMVSISPSWSSHNSIRIYRQLHIQ